MILDHSARPATAVAFARYLCKNGKPLQATDCEENARTFGAWVLLWAPAVDSHAVNNLRFGDLSPGVRGAGNTSRADTHPHTSFRRKTTRVRLSLATRRMRQMRFGASGIRPSFLGARERCPILAGKNIARSLLQSCAIVLGVNSRRASYA